MTVHNKLWLVCDAPECGNVFHASLDADHIQLRVEARAAGWKIERFNPKAHLCPEHNGAAA